MNTAQRILKNTLSLLVSGIFTQGIGFLVAVFLARALGPEDFGKVNFALALVAFFLLLADLGLPLFGARETANHPSGVGVLAGTVLSLRLVLALFSFCLLSGTVLVLDKPPQIKLLILLYGLSLFPAALLLEWVFQGMERMQYIGIARCLLVLLYGGGVWGFVQGPEDVYRVPVVHVLASLLSSAALFLFFRRLASKLTLGVRPRVWGGVLRRALPLGLSLFMIQIFYSLDSVMLGFIKGEESVGLYNAAYKIILVPILVAGFYHDALFPVVSRTWKRDPDALQAILGNTQKIMLTLAVPLLVGGTLVSRPLVLAMYGEPYEGCTDAFRILLWAVVIIYVNITCSRALLACGRDAWYLAGVAVPAAVNVLFNLLLIPPYGLNGAALATVLAEASGFFVMVTGFRKVVRLALVPNLARTLASAGIMAAVLLFQLHTLEWHVFPAIGIAMLSYFASLGLLKGIPKKELALLYDTLLQRPGALPPDRAEPCGR